MTDARSDRYILFVVAGTTYALPSQQVAHVEMVETITPVPNAATFVDGIVFSRGQVVPAINLRARFGFERLRPDLRTRLLVVTTHGRSVGLVVDACREFLTIPASAIRAPGEALAEVSARYLAGVAIVGERLTVILNLDELLNTSDPEPAGLTMSSSER
jgi:purine-binding chemotaxis protein CheW